MMKIELTELIERSGLKQKFIAAQVGIHPTYLSQLKRGRRPPQLRDREALGAFFSVPGEDIVFCKRS